MDEPGTSDSRPILVEEDHDRCHDSDSQAESDDAGATDEASSTTVVSLLDRLRRLMLVELRLFNPHRRLQNVFFLSLLVHLASSRNLPYKTISNCQ